MTHDYLSTACHHETTADTDQAAELHAYCAGTSGHSGVKLPATCKWCNAHCSCPRHQQEPSDDPT